MERELRAQFERFAATGLPLDHVDGHQHIHIQPAVFHALLSLARQYGASGVRLPRDDFGLAMHYDRRGAAVKAVWATVFGVLCRSYARDLDGTDGSGGSGSAHRLAVADRVYGLMQSGKMEQAYVLRVLEREAASATAESSLQPVGIARPSDRLKPQVPAGNRRVSGQASSRSVELYFHPTVAYRAEPLGPNRGDLAALLSPAVRQAVEAGGWVRASYATLREPQ
jgi:hypothetical protein